MDAASALDDLLEISSHVEAAAILAGDELVAATPGGERLAAPGRELLLEAGKVGGGRTPTRVEAALRDGAVAVLHADDRTLVARTTARPPSALLFHDLAACLSLLEEPARA